jgi:predicted nucleic acid-binding protein
VIILDTNVVSETMRPAPDPRVIAWIDALSWRDSHITVITAGELWQGVFGLPPGRRRDVVGEKVDLALMSYEGRVAPVDDRAAPHFAQIRADRRRAGRPIRTSDAWIAAVCRRYDVPLATRNVTDFDGTGIAVVNPWDGP